MKLVCLFFVTLRLLGPEVFGAKILALFHWPTRSHYIMGMALARGLVAKGHDVVMVTSYISTEKNPRMRNVYLENMKPIMDEYADVFQTLHNSSLLQLITKTSGLIDKLTEGVFQSTEMQNLLDSDEKFDLCIFEAIMNDAHYAIAHKYNVPFIVVSTTGSLHANHLTGNLAPYSFVPNMDMGPKDKMTFTERLTNSGIGVLHQIAWHFKLLPDQETLYRKYFKEGPELRDITRNVSLILVNAHVCLETPRPYLPNMITIGGFHVGEPEKLPKYLQNYLDDAKDGAIFFSLGTNLKSADLPEDKLNMIMDTFRKLPQKILWKFENEDLPNKPDNVKISKWFPQNDVLAHPNVKLFISHGGLLSSTEAVYRGVPILGIPFYGDQKTNILNIVSGGYGLNLEFADLTEETFTESLKELLTNPKYSENVKRRSAIIHDQPEKPLDRAVFWVEHIMRHNGGQHLRSAVVDLTLVQYLLLDVVAFVSVVYGTLLVGLVLLCKTLCCSPKKQIKEKSY